MNVAARSSLSANGSRSFPRSVIHPYFRASQPSHTSESPATTKRTKAQRRSPTPGDMARRNITGHTAILATVMTFGRVKRLPDTVPPLRKAT